MVRIQYRMIKIWNKLCPECKTEQYKSKDYNKVCPECKEKIAGDVAWIKKRSGIKEGDKNER